MIRYSNIVRGSGLFVISALAALSALSLAACGGAAASPASADGANPAPTEEPPGSANVPPTAAPLDAAAPEGSEPGDGAEPAVACLRTVPVATSAALNGALHGAHAGDCILLADGDYAFDAVAATGTASAPIVVRAKNRGKATVSTTGLTLNGAAYVTIEGLLYTSSSGIELTNCDHCRLTRNTLHIHETGTVSWVQIHGSHGGHNRIDHNELGPKTHEGNLIGIYGSGSTVLAYTQIDHNFFHDVGPVTSNGWETIRAGLSGLSHSSGFITIEHNLFQNCQGDPEIISTKSCDDIVRYNTLRTSKGQICLRIGSRNSVYGNYILGGGVAGTGGIRVHGQDHKVYDNYIEAIDDDGIDLEGGESEETPDPGAFHYRVYRAQIVFNTIIGAHTGVQIGGVHPLSPVDSVIANNIVQASSGSMFREAMNPVNTKYQGNIANPTGSAALGITATAGQVAKKDPLLVKTGGIFKLSAQSPAIGAATGSFPFVTDDIDGDPRVKADVGADQYSNAASARPPLTEADVGPNSP